MSTISQLNYIHENPVGCKRDTLQRQLSHLDRKIARQGKSKIKRLEKEMGNIKKKIIKKIFYLNHDRRFYLVFISMLLIVGSIVSIAASGPLGLSIALGALSLFSALAFAGAFFCEYRLSPLQQHRPLDARASRDELLSMVEKMVIKKNKPMVRLYILRCSIIDEELDRLDKKSGNSACFHHRKQVLCLERAHSSTQVTLLNHPYTRP